MRRVLLTVVWVVALLGLVGAPALADGIIIPHPPPEWPTMPLRSLAIKYHHVTVEIDGQVATTHVDQVFLNESGYELEGDYIFPLPAGASISRFAMWVDGQPVEGRVLEADEARRIYEDIVRQRRDPALLEYVGQNAYRARVYPIPAFGEQRIEIEYSEVLSADGGLVRYVYPLSTEQFSSRPLESVRVTVEIAAHAPLKTVYSPSHSITVTRVGDRQATAVYEEEDVLPSTDLSLYYSVSEEDLAVDLLSFREDPEDGFFLLLLSPGAGLEAAEAEPKDVLFVVDTSGSMRGQKIEQAKDAARYVLDNLNPEDRFNIIAFSSTVEPYAGGLRPIEERDAARVFINRLSAGGGTNIHAALTTALDQIEEGRPQVVVFLTDGLPTEGEVRSERILEAVRERATGDVRLFSFGVGYDVNTILLDTISQEQRGASAYVQPGEDIEAAVSAFYDKISLPVLTDVTLDYGGIDTSEVYPFPLPDVFSGSQLVVVGRYREGGETTLTLTGTRGEGRERYVYDGSAFEVDGGPDFIPRLWATRKIGHLLTQIRLHGPDGELIDEIVDLSVRYGIVTPYTSFLVDETEDALSAEGRQNLADQYLAGAPVPGEGADRGGIGGGGAPAAPTATGRDAVEASVAQEALRSAEASGEPEHERVRAVGSRSFVLQGEVWVDTTYDAGAMPIDRVPWGSAAYFHLLAEHPDWGGYLALGPRVILVWEGRAIEIVPEGSAPSTRYPRERNWG